MSILSKEEWNDWKQNNVTKAFLEAAAQRESDAREILVSSAGLDQASDNFYRGFITAYHEIQDFKIEDVE